MIEELRKKIENSYYWDARVKSLDCNYFGDEVKLIFGDNNEEIVYWFQECYKIKVEQSIEYPKNLPSRELEMTQVPYFIQDVELNEVTLVGKEYLEFKINMFPVELYVLCKKLDIFSTTQTNA